MELDAARVVGAGLSLVVMGVLMGFSPTLYAVVLHHLNRSSRANVMIRHLAAGLGLGTLVMLLAFRAVDPTELTRHVGGTVKHLLVQRNVDAGVGLLFLLLAGIEAFRSRKPHRAPRLNPFERSLTPTGVFLFGTVSAAFSTNRILVTYATSRVSTGSTDAWWWQIPLYAVFLTALVGPYLLSSWVWERFPRASGYVQHVYDWLTHWDSRQAIALALLVVGVAFLAVAFWSKLWV